MTSSLRWEHYDRGAHTEPKRFQIDQEQSESGWLPSWMAHDAAAAVLQRGLPSLADAVAWCEGRMWGDAEPDAIME